MKMKIELSADLAKTVSELLHGYQESVAYDVAYAPTVVRWLRSSMPP